MNEKLKNLLKSLLGFVKHLFTGNLVSYKIKSKHSDQLEREWHLDKSIVWIVFAIYGIVHFYF